MATQIPVVMLTAINKEKLRLEFPLYSSVLDKRFNDLPILGRHWPICKLKCVILALHSLIFDENTAFRSILMGINYLQDNCASPTKTYTSMWKTRSSVFHRIALILSLMSGRRAWLILFEFCNIFVELPNWIWWNPVLLAILPIEDESSQDANEHYELIQFVLSVSDRGIEVALIGDKKSTNYSISWKVGPIFVGWHSHRHNVAMKDILAE